MRTKALALTIALAIAALVLAITALSLAQKTGAGTTETASGIVTTTLQTAHGKIKLSLPDDMAAGDTISGTVAAEPSGKTDKERERSTGELNGYVVELENQKSPVSGGVMQRIHLAVGITSASLILLDEKGKQVATAKIPVAPAPTTGPSNFLVRSVGQTGRPIQVHGPFDGDSTNTSAKVGGADAKVLAESPRKIVCESPREVVGPTRIEVTEGCNTATGSFRNLKIDLTAPKTSLLKGESTELHVEVSGLEGITQPIPVQLQNLSPSTVNVAGGNTQTIVIQPGQVQTGGTFPWSTGLNGLQSGSFTITGSVPSEPNAVPDLTPTPTATPTPSTAQPTPTPSPKPNDTVVFTASPTPPQGGDNVSPKVPIELIQLSLTSCDPIKVGFPTPTPTPEPTPFSYYVPSPAPTPSPKPSPAPSPAASP